MTPAKHIVVVGSANMDLVCRTRRIPRPGETILGDSLLTVPGGKGANQAVAAARLSGPDTDVYLVARVGEDDFGQRLLIGLTQSRVRTEHVTITERVASGCAMILVDTKGENSIVVASGANAKLSVADIDRVEPLIASAAAVVVQLEIPLETVARALELSRKHGVYTILDPAPVPPDGLPRELFAVDVLTPNQREAEMLLGRRGARHLSTKRVEDPKMIAGKLLSRGSGVVVTKLGSKGALVVERDGNIERVKAHKVLVTDTTAAGDAFTGALAVAHAEGQGLIDAVRFANAAGAAACTQFGAWPALPDRETVLKLLRDSNSV